MSFQLYFDENLGGERDDPVIINGISYSTFKESKSHFLRKTRFIFQSRGVLDWLFNGFFFFLAFGLWI